jgi:hypothetical protein
LFVCFVFQFLFVSGSHTLESWLDWEGFDESEHGGKKKGGRKSGAKNVKPEKREIVQPEAERIRGAAKRGRNSRQGQGQGKAKTASASSIEISRHLE